MRHETLNSIEDNKKNVATKISVATKYKFNILGSEAKQNLIESALKARIEIMLTLHIKLGFTINNQCLRPIIQCFITVNSHPIPYFSTFPAIS